VKTFRKIKEVSDENFENQLNSLQKRKEQVFFFMLINNGFEKNEKRRELKGVFKLAYIKLGKTLKQCFIDEKTNKAYKMQNTYENTLIQIPRFTFVRYCNGWDL